MGNLPKSKIGTRTLVLGDEEVEVRGLLRREIGEMFAPIADGNDGPEARARVDVITVALGVGVTEEEAAEWVASAPGGHVIKVIEAVMDLSGMSEDSGKG